MAIKEAVEEKNNPHLYGSSMGSDNKKVFDQKWEDVENFPIDFVVTWVNDKDVSWRSQKERYAQGMQIQQNQRNNGEERYRDWELFCYWFRAVETYAPWVRNVYLVTWGHVPQWLNLQMPKLRVIKHSDFIPQAYLPTFNSNAIELNLHRIPGLSEHFVYFNDDVFLARPVLPDDFFRNGQPNYPAIVFPLHNEENSCFSHTMFTVLGAINEYYTPNIRRIICNHPDKWFAKVYGRYCVANLNAARLRYIPGMYFTHLAVPFCKTDFSRTWKTFPELLKETSEHKFRTAQDALHFLITLQTIMEGYFQPVSIGHYGKNFGNPPKQLNEICTALREKKYRCICINDSPAVSWQDYSTLKLEINKAMQDTFPKKSSFERDVRDF